MPGARLRTFRLALCAALPLLCAAAAHGAPPALPRADSLGAFLELGMPLSARREFLALSPAARAQSPLLPKLLRRLAESGHAEEALSLFEEAQPILAGEVRSETFFEAGRILWARKEYEKAAGAFRQVSGRSAKASEAALYLARIVAAGGDTNAALQQLSAAPSGGKRSLLAGEIEMMRGNPSGAAAAWNGAPPGSDAGFFAKVLTLSRAEGPEDALRELRAVAGNVSGAFPERAASLEALALARLSRKDSGGALSVARELLAENPRWKGAAGNRPPWDGTKRGAEGSWKALGGLFPYGEDAGRFVSAGRRFLAAAALHETLQAAETGAGETSRRVSAAREGVSGRRRAVADRIRRIEEIRNSLLADKRRMEEMRARLKDAADSLPLHGLGVRIDPQRAALIEKVGIKAGELQERLAKARAATNAATEKGRANALPPEDRRMVFFAQQRVARAEDSLNALEGRAAFLRAKVWNRWKREHVARLSVALEKAETAAKTAAVRAERAEKALPPLRAEYAELATWTAALDRYGKRLADRGGILAKRRAESKSHADRALSEARRELLSAIARRERGAQYLAGRAATEWRIAVPAADNSAPSPARRGELLGEAIGYWEAILPSAAERDPLADESLYALAELRYEEAESLFLQKEGTRGAVPDCSKPISLFRRLIAEYPDSPYAEPAYYGMALCYQETGAADNAVAAMKTLLARYPGTRFADEIHLRLGESAFDEHEFKEAEEAYRKVSAGTPPELRVTALYKLGWSFFLQGRPKESVEPFLDALLLSPSAVKTGGLRRESLQMLARSLVESDMDASAETFLAQRGASAYGPAVLLRIQGVLDGQNRYEEAAAVADRIGASYPLAAERLDAEPAAAEALRKAKKEEESHTRRGRLHLVLGPGSAWRKSPSRTAGERARADALSEEGLRSAAFYFHGRSRETPPGDRRAIFALYDAHIFLFPASPKAEEVAYQRAWLLFEDGRKGEAGPAFEAVARRPAGTRGEAAWYMAVQCAKDVSSGADAKSQAEIIRLCREYERSFPKGKRLHLVVPDRARAHFIVRQFAEAAEAADRAAGLAKGAKEWRAALRLAADARFEREDFEGAEKTFQALLSSSPGPEETKENEKWVGFSMFRRAEKMPQGKAAEAADLFLRIAKEFPALDIAPTARFRAGTSYAEAEKTQEAIAAFLPVESSAEAGSSLSLDATRWLARLYEKSGDPLPAAERYERLGTAPGLAPEEEIKILLRAAELFSRGKDETRARRGFLAVASLSAAPADLRMRSYYRAAESARSEGKAEEADRYYEEAIHAQQAAPGVLPEIAGKAFFRRAEFRLRKYRGLAIAPPLGKTFAAKQASLEECTDLYLEAIRQGDALTVSASLHRLGELFEDFRSAVLSSPPPPGLSDREREEYVFLMEERAAPIEEKAVEAYLKNLRHAVSTDYFSPWVEKSLRRLASLRPARFGKKGEYAFPVLTVPDFRGIIERKGP